MEFGALPPEHRTTVAAILFASTRLSNEAVMVFFVLSGFLVGGQVIRHFRGGAFDITSYVVERCTRILLPLIPTCLLTAAIGTLVLGHEPVWLRVILNMVGLNGVLVDTLADNLPLWTIAYEIWFYILAGTVGYLLSSRQPSAIALIVIGCGVCAFSLLAARYLLFWGAGALAVLFLDVPRRRELAAIGLSAFVVGTIGYQLGMESKSFASAAYLSAPVAEALMCFGVSMCLPFLCASSTNNALHFLRSPALQLSAMSYTLYLVHYPLIVALDQHFPRARDLSWNAIAIFGLKVTLLLLVAWVFYLAFEANTSALRRSLKRWLGLQT